jgi:hypothetical protein
MTKLNDFISRYRRQLAATIGGTMVLGVLAHAVAQPAQQPLYQSANSPIQITQPLPSASQFGPVMAASTTDETLSQARAIVSNLDLGTAADQLESHKSKLVKSAIDLEYEAALAKTETNYQVDRDRVEADYDSARTSVDARYHAALNRVENVYKATLEKVEKDYAAERAGAPSEPAREVVDRAYNDHRDAASKVYNEARFAADKTFNVERQDVDLAYNQAKEAADLAYNNAHQSVQDAYGSVVYQDLTAEFSEETGRVVVSFNSGR